MTSLMSNTHASLIFNEPEAPRPEDLGPEELAAAGLRWMTKEEYMAHCARRDNAPEAAIVDYQAGGKIPLVRQQLELAVAAVDALVFELRSKRRRLVSEGTVHELPSPFFCDSQGLDEASWREVAAAARADLSKLAKTGPPADDAELQQVCDLRMAEASACNVATRIKFNEVLLRRAIDEARQNVRLVAAILEDLQQRARRVQ